MSRFRKTCQRASIPTPERGYWARKEAGKKILVPPLPERLPAMEDEVLLGGGRDMVIGSGREKNSSARLRHLPNSIFSLEAVRERIVKIIGTLTVPREVRV